MKSVCVLFLSVFVLAAAPRSVSAQPDSKPTAAAEASAREHYQRGQRLSARGEYAAAYREFAAGYALTERPLFLFNMAEAARANGELARARENYQQFLRIDPKNAMAPTAQARLVELSRPPVGPPAPGTPPPDSGAPAPFGPSPEQPRLFPPPATATTGPDAPVATTPERTAPPSAAPTPTPMWRRLPFWAAVGGTVLISGAILIAATRDNDVCGSGCSEINFR